MKNYYDILGLSSFEDNQDAILSAYKNDTSKLREAIYDRANIEERLILLNEAYLVLSDASLKKRYDYALSLSQGNDELEQELLQKHTKAKEFISSKLATASKKKKKNKWPAILCVFFLLSALGPIMKTCSQVVVESSEAPSEFIGRFNPDSNWSNFEIANSFSISIPNTMELRNEYDPYTRLLQNNSYVVSYFDAVFQQKNLSVLSTDAYDTYCRVLIQHYSFSPGEVEHHNQTSYITQDDKRNFREMVDAEIGPWNYVQAPTFQWIDISGIKALEAIYKRTGKNGPVNCYLYLLPNYDEMVKMIVSYREKDADRWKVNLENIIRTFNWNNPK